MMVPYHPSKVELVNDEGKASNIKNR